MTTVDALGYERCTHLGSSPKQMHSAGRVALPSCCLQRQMLLAVARPSPPVQRQMLLAVALPSSCCLVAVAVADAPPKC